MPVVVADTGPLNYLVRIGHADVLRQLFQAVSVPGAVLAELQHPRAPGAVRAFALDPPPWLLVGAAAVAVDLPRGLDRGEREALSLGLATRAELVLVDDRPAVLAARRHGLATTGTLGVLKRAAEAGLLDIGQAVAALQATNFYVRPDILAALFAPPR